MTLTGAEKAAERLHRWATRDLGLPPPAVPTPGELAQLCRGGALRAVERLIAEVVSPAAADTLAANLALRGGLDAVLVEYRIDQDGRRS
jgi:hypothetical protein